MYVNLCVLMRQHTLNPAVDLYQNVWMKKLTKINMKYISIILYLHNAYDQNIINNQEPEGICH